MALRGIANVALTVAGDTETLREIEATFRALDDDGDGRVPYAAMVQYLKHGGFELSDTEMEVLISQMDVEEAGFVRYDDWLAAMFEWRTMQARPPLHEPPRSMCHLPCCARCSHRLPCMWITRPQRCLLLVARARGTAKYSSW